MKILIIHPSFSSIDARGSEVIAQETYKLLKDNGETVYYFATNKQPYLENTSWTNYFPQYIPRFSIRWWWNFEAKHNLAKMLDEIKPDIVHVHGTYMLSYSIYQPIIKRNIPIVTTIHDTGIVCPGRSGIDYVRNEVCNKCKDFSPINCLINNCIQTKKRVSSLNVTIANIIENFSGYNKKINKFVVPSIALKKYITSKNIPDDKITVIPNFIDKQFAKNSEVSNKQEYFLIVGTLSFYKGTDMLFEALKDLPRDIPIKIIGNDLSGNKYKCLKTKYNLYNVNFIDCTSRLDLINFYKNCISVVMPSNCYESFGMINIEAGICGKPSIAANIGGIPEVVDNNRTGLIFDFGSEEQLKLAILKYWNNKQLAEEHGKNAKEKVLNFYSENIYLRKITQLYKEVIGNAK